MKTIFLFLVLFSPCIIVAQTTYTIRGHFPQAANSEISLRSFTGLKEAEMVATKTDSLGVFTLSYPVTYTGAALLVIKDKASVIVLLNKENFSLQWDNLKDFQDFKVVNSAENTAFTDGLKLYQNQEAKLAGLNYIAPFYSSEPTKLKWITTEIKGLTTGFDRFVNQLPAALYAKSYLKLRQLISQMPATASKYIERMPQHETAFNTMDLADPKIIHSGLYADLFDGYFLLMESHGVDKMYPHVDASTDAVLKSLQKNPDSRLEVSEYLFKMFEKRSLFPAAQHLALVMLSNDQYKVDVKRLALFEQYRKMAVGNTAPDIIFSNPSKNVATLKDVKAKYKLVVFGSSWCSTCVEEIPKLKNFYADWQQKYDLEIVFISLDTEKDKYAAFTKDFPWINSCDYQKWDSKAVRDFYVFGTPTMFLLDANNTILVKPVSVGHLEAWMKGKEIVK